MSDYIVRFNLQQRIEHFITMVVFALLCLTGLPQKFYQAAPFITLTMHQIAPYTVLISEKSWRKLDARQQEILTKAATDAGAAAMPPTRG